MFSHHTGGIWVPLPEGVTIMWFSNLLSSITGVGSHRVYMTFPRALTPASLHSTKSGSRTPEPYPSYYRPQWARPHHQMHILFLSLQHPCISRSTPCPGQPDLTLLIPWASQASQMRVFLRKNETNSSIHAITERNKVSLPNTIHPLLPTLVSQSEKMAHQ